MCALCGVTHTLITVLHQCLPRPHHPPFPIHTHCLSHYKYTEKSTHTKIFYYLFIFCFQSILDRGVFSPHTNLLQAHRFSGSDRNALSNCILSPYNTIHLISDMNQPVKQNTYNRIINISKYMVIWTYSFLETHQRTFRTKDFLTCAF